MGDRLLLLGSLLIVLVNIESLNAAVVGECTDNNAGDAVHLPHDSNCTLFYICDWGNAVLRECPDGLHFNPTLQVCDWPEEAGCESSNNEDDDNSNNDETVIGECPADNEGDAVHLPHESDCTLFYKCDWGVPVLQECPDDLHFNPTLQVCDYPEEAGCESGSNDGGNGNGDGEGGSEEEESSTDNSAGGNEENTTASGECPADNEGDAVHLPHESDCTLFYKCDWGVPVLQECPDDLHFNPNLQVCDYPEDAGCESGSNDGGNGNGDGEGGSEEEESSTDNSAGGNEENTTGSGECPADNEGDAVHLPHESDCRLFYKCDWGVPVLQECPDDLHFNPTLQVCDYPEDAGCESGSNDGGNGNGDGEGGSEEEESSTDNSAGGNEENTTGSGECPADNEGDAVHLPHESDCTLFYKCDWGVPVLQECPDDLHFNPTLQVCDYPEDAGCESGSNDGGNGNGDGEGGSEEEESSTDNSAGGNEENTTASGECPADNEGDAVHLPHESDCTLFYKCDWGVPVLQECPDDLHFNPTLQVCDYPEDAGCESGSNDGGNGNGDGEGGSEEEQSSTDNSAGGNEENTTGSGECPADNEGDAVHLPHESDCTLFYKCDWGVPVLQECPDDLHFNPTLQVCDYPEDAGCESGSNDGGNGNGDGEGGSEEEESSTDNSAGGNEENTTGSGECPADNEGDAVHLPHESDCTLFYKCDWGVPVLQECPDDLHFNPTLQVCDYPEDAGCESGSNDGGNGNGDGEGGSEEEESSTDNSAGGNEENTTASGECPADNEGDAVHLPHESDCTLFYKCDWGVPVLQACPDDLHFNPTLQVCDYPEDAGCESGSNDGGNGNGDGEGGSEEEESSTDNSAGGNEENTTGSGECPADNEGDAVHLPHESDCTLFYKCDWGVPVLQECPDDLHFNPTLQVCDYPEDAGCESSSNDGGNGNGNGEGGSEEEESSTDNSAGGNEENTTASGECPADNEGDAVHLPHESDCTLFYKCDWGVPVLQECPDDLHFNPTLQVCDYPEDAGCENGSNDGGNGNGDGEGGSEEEESSTDNSAGGNEENTTASGECPADNEGDAVHLPHESDCTLFYKCDWGVPVLQECPDDLHFNPTLQVCDYPEDAGCENGSNDGGNGNGDGEGGSEEEESSTDNSAGGNEENTTASGECPADNEGDAVHLPHESDCTLFYKCDWGVPVLQECPDDLHFNPTLQVCDYPEDAGCESGSNDGGNGNGDGEGGSEEEQSSTDNSAGGNEENTTGSGECPADNEGDAVHLPHESDCTLFYKCDWGVPVLQECPDGLHFNPTLQVCDYPEDAGCESGSNDGGNGNGDGEGGSEEEESSTDNSAGGNEENTTASGECPADNEGDAVHLPHESDCTLFYKCDWGVPVLQECPDDLHFNPTLQVCDYPEDAGCESGSNDGGNGNGDGEGGSEEEESSTDNSAGGNEENTTASGECPADNEGDAVHLPHESDCTLFYKCDWGVPVLQECPDDLHFNPTLQVCDYPEDAGCESGSNDGGNGNGDGEGGSEEEESSTDNSAGGNEENTTGSGECPADNEGDAVHLPHESDCRLFYKCDWGVPVLQECPDDLHFNPTLQVCDYPEDAGCESGSNDGGNGNGDGEGGSEEEEGSTDNSAGGNEENTTASGECPADNEGDAVHLPHESDCTLFYKCDWGVPVLQECPDGLHFNPILEVCDWPEVAGCEGASDGNENNSDSNEDGSDNVTEQTTEDQEDNDNDSNDGSAEVTEQSTEGQEDNDNVSEEDSSQVTEQSTENNSDNVTGFCDSVSCPAENEEYVTFIPNEEDCTRFCKCNWGLAYEFICRDGLYFNPTLNVCDWPEDSGCTMKG